MTGTGLHRVQIIYFFRGQLGSWTPSGIGLVSDSRLRRMRRRLGLSRELWIENLRDLDYSSAHCHAPCLYISADGSGRARGVGVCPRLVPTLGDSWETSKNRTASEKSKLFGHDGAPFPVKKVNYPRPPRKRNSGLVGPHTTPPIVNHKYMTYA